ncbi:MAG: apolipoprotein N-acyltransferase [Marinosulfonomonas sp.]
MALTGAVIALGLAPFSWPVLAVPALCLALLFGVTAKGTKRAATCGGLLGFGYALVALFWIVEPFQVDAAQFGWMAPFALFFMAAGFAVFWSIAFALAGRFSTAGTAGRVAALALFWTATEMLRSTLFTGFPWALLSYIWIETPAYQLAAILGPHGVTLITVLGASLIAFAAANRRMGAGLAGAGVFAGLLALGAWVGTAPVLKSENAPLVRLIQPNADQKLKWDPVMMPVFFDRQLSLTAEPAEQTPDLVIWPEVAVPFLLNGAPSELENIADAAGAATAILGGQRLDGVLAFNSMAVLTQEGQLDQVYDKRHLVPFGEYLPFGWMLQKIGLKAMTAKYGYGYAAGQGPAMLDLGKYGHVLPLICYEGIFPHEVRDTQRRPDWMLLITNDAWFGKVSGPFQHLAQAQARSIELGLPMVRVANTGITAVIDAHGKIVAALPQGVPGKLDVTLPGRRSETVYAKLGDIPVYFLMIVLLLGAICLRRGNKIDPKAGKV